MLTRLWGSLTGRLGAFWAGTILGRATKQDTPEKNAEPQDATTTTEAQNTATPDDDPSATAVDNPEKPSTDDALPTETDEPTEVNSTPDDIPEASEIDAMGTAGEAGGGVDLLGSDDGGGWLDFLDFD